MRRFLLTAAALLAVFAVSDARPYAARAAAAPERQNSPGAAPEEKTSPKFAPAQVLQTVDAAYPIQSVAFGTVVVEVHLAASGEIEEVKVVQDIPSLTEQALKAVKEWKFRAATLDGKPVTSVVPVAFIFVRPDLLPRFGGPPKPQD